MFVSNSFTINFRGLLELDSDLSLPLVIHAYLSGSECFLSGLKEPTGLGLIGPGRI